MVSGKESKNKKDTEVSVQEKYQAIEKKLSLALWRVAPTLLFSIYGIIYIWYGLLKVLGLSPVEELVQRATDWIFSHEFVLLLGFWECILGLSLIIPKLRRFGLLLLFLQFPGTFLPLFTNPEDCFTSFPFALTLEGQYIFKNLILITGGLVMIGTLHGMKKKSKNPL